MTLPDGITLHVGDCIDVLRTLPDASVNCCVTSPPYWGLRDYGTAQWEGGEDWCDHIERSAQSCHASSTLGPKRDGLTPDNAAFKSLERQFRDTCAKCGARRVDRQIGIEETPDAYVAKMVAVFREVRRVLRDDGTCWINLGDSYSGSPVGSFNGGGFKDSSAQSGGRDMSGVATSGTINKLASSGLKPKDLVGIPWRVAFALQADGWWLRQDIIWHKPNPMPESVTDRCTKAHEYVFLLSKSARYWYDADAIAERAVSLPHAPGNNPRNTGGGQDFGDGRESEVWGSDGTRNRRSVWTITTKPYAEAHFATFPEELPRTCILAGCPVGGTVLDPFAGSGTTLAVAHRLGRKAVGIELNPEYAKLIDDRVNETHEEHVAVPLFEQPELFA